MIRFCTYFDENYLVRGLTLCRSILEYLPDCEVWILCLDARTHEAVRAVALPQVKAISVGELYRADPELERVAGTRNLIESYFTSTPSWCLYVFEHAQPEDVICYVDADLLFYCSPLVALDELGTGSILVMPHRFPPGSSSEVTRGVFNVGLVAFRKTASARDCIERWRLQCLESCSDSAGGDGFADQKYLDDWPRLYSDVVISKQLGSCLAPWNIGQFRFERQNGSFTVNGEPLVFFHFHGLTIFAPRLYDSGLAEYGVEAAKAEKALYAGYVA